MHSGSLRKSRRPFAVYNPEVQIGTATHVGDLLP